MPPPVWYVPSRQMPPVVVNVANQGQRWRHGGMVVQVVEEEEVRAVVLIRQVLIQPRVDDGENRIGVKLLGYVADNRLGKEEEEALR